MYFDVFTILLILTYQCLMLCSSSMGMADVSSTTSKPTGADDCLFMLPNKDDIETPMPALLHRKAISIGLRERKGYLTVKHRAFLKLSCKKGQLISLSKEEKLTRITVRCVRKQSVEYLGKVHVFSEIKCIGEPIKPTIIPRENKTESTEVNYYQDSSESEEF